MKFSNLPYFAFFILVAFLLVSCKPSGNSISSANTENSELDFVISKTDTNYNIQFYNKRISDIKIQKILLNNSPLKYTTKSDEMITLKNDSMRLGKNNIQIVYEFNKQSIILQKDYFNILELDYVVANSFPHNRTYFTEGLMFDKNDALIESTGLENNSKIIFYNPFQDGYKVKDSVINIGLEFGEGISIINDQLVQLLWKNNYLKIYNAGNHKFMRNMEYLSEGWGLCTDGNNLYASNGSSNISKIDIKGPSVKISQTIAVQDEMGLVTNLNELEWVNGYIFANIWQSNTICIIDPKNGFVIGKIDLSILVEKEKRMSNYIDVLNGIAWNRNSQTLLVTGKYWNQFYELKLNKEIGKPAPVAVSKP